MIHLITIVKFLHLFIFFLSLINIFILGWTIFLAFNSNSTLELNNQQKIINILSITYILTFLFQFYYC
jgi:hypothetical protein